MVGTVRARFLGLVLAVSALVVAATACTGGGDGGKRTGSPRPNPTGPVKATVDWDLSQGHSTKQVKWRGQSSFEVGGGVDVRLKLPGVIFHDRVDRFGADREGDQISDIVIYWPGDTIDGAYARVKQLAPTWRLDTANLESWHRNLQASPGRPADLPRVIANAHGLKPTGPGGPVASAQISYSFDTSYPAMVKLEFFWKPS